MVRTLLVYHACINKSERYISDTTQDLSLAALESIPILTDTVETGFAFAIFTGDIISHDTGSELSRSALYMNKNISL